MANFEKAFARTMEHEGLYANHKLDRGGETFAGVARNYHPNWPGWKIIDSIKPHCSDIKTLNAALEMNRELQSLVHSFYKQGFWDVGQLDRFESQLLAENVFDASVNCGVARGARLLQQALNKLSGYNLAVDNVIGNKTFSALEDAMSRFGERKIIDTYIDLRKEFHKSIVKRDPTQAVFLRNWLSRCEAMRKEA